MFKKTIAALLAIAIVISFVGCEGVKKDSVPKRKYDKTDPSAVLEEITNDFNAVALYITEELEKHIPMSEQHLKPIKKQGTNR